MSRKQQQGQEQLFSVKYGSVSRSADENRVGLKVSRTKGYSMFLMEHAASAAVIGRALTDRETKSGLIP